MLSFPPRQVPGSCPLRFTSLSSRKANNITWPYGKTLGNVVTLVTHVGFKFMLDFCLVTFLCPREWLFVDFPVSLAADLPVPDVSVGQVSTTMGCDVELMSRESLWQGRGQDVSKKNLRTATHVRSRICLVFEFHPTWLQLRLRFCEVCRDLLQRSLWTPTSTPLGSWWSMATFDLADTHIRPYSNSDHIGSLSTLPSPNYATLTAKTNTGQFTFEPYLIISAYIQGLERLIPL